MPCLGGGFYSLDAVLTSVLLYVNELLLIALLLLHPNGNPNYSRMFLIVCLIGLDYPLVIIGEVSLFLTVTLFWEQCMYISLAV